MDKIIIHGKEFKTFATAQEIERAISVLAEKMNTELSGKDVVFLPVLNGSFMFAAELLKRIKFQCKISFAKLASYDGYSSTGQVRQLIGIGENLSTKIVVIVEDIIDTGNTLENIIKQIKGFEPLEIKIATLLFKPVSYKKEHVIDYIGMKAPNEFLIGYGLDYNGYGRNLNGIYIIENQVN